MDIYGRKSAAMQKFSTGQTVSRGTERREQYDSDMKGIGRQTNM